MIATPKTAGFAGAWAVLGLVPFEKWIDGHGELTTATRNVLWMAMFALFVFLPAYFMVFGAGQKPFGRAWFLDREERARYAVVTKRMLAWFLSAALVGTAWSLTLMWVTG